MRRNPADRRVGFGPGRHPATEAAGMTRTMQTVEELEAWLVSLLARQLGVDPATINPAEPFSQYGLDLARATTLLAPVAAELGRPLAPTLVWIHPTPLALARHLLGQGDNSARPDFKSTATMAVDALEQPVGGPSVAPEVGQEALAALTAGERRRHVKAYLRAQVAAVLGLPREALEADEPLSHLGLDSLMALDLGNRVDTDWGVVVPIATFLRR